jgi:hypothetical protein
VNEDIFALNDDIARLLGEDGTNDGGLFDELLSLGPAPEQLVLLTPPPAGGGGATPSRTPTPPPPPRGRGRPPSTEPRSSRSRTPEQRAHDARMAQLRRRSKPTNSSRRAAAEQQRVAQRALPAREADAAQLPFCSSSEQSRSGALRSACVRMLCMRELKTLRASEHN